MFTRLGSLQGKLWSICEPSSMGMSSLLQFELTTIARMVPPPTDPHPEREGLLERYWLFALEIGMLDVSALAPSGRVVLHC